MLEVIGMDFVKTARAKGVGPGRVIRAHVLRNALLPVITFAGIQLGQMAGGAVLTETVFAWPGIGRLMFDALLQRDYQLLLGIFLVTSIMVVVFNLLTDVLYRLIDPRIGAERNRSRRMKSFARRYMRNHGAVAGLVIVLLVVAVARPRRCCMKNRRG